MYYLKNWYTEMDLVCMKSSTIGMMITAYYIGFALGGLFFAFPDKYGRKWSCMMGLLISCVSQTAMIVSSNYWMRLFMFGVMGFSQIKNSVSYVWLSECTSKDYKSRAFTAINVFDALPMVITCFYFLFVSKNWVHLSLFFCLLCWVALIVAFICPESPRWLLVSGRSVDGINELNKIGRMNKVSGPLIPLDTLFVEDPMNLQAVIGGSDKLSEINHARQQLLKKSSESNQSGPLYKKMLQAEGVQPANGSPLLRKTSLSNALSINNQVASKLTAQNISQDAPQNRLRSSSIDDFQIKRKVRLNPVEIGRQALNWKQANPDASFTVQNNTS